MEFKVHPREQDKSYESSRYFTGKLKDFNRKICENVIYLTFSGIVENPWDNVDEAFFISWER